MPNFTRAIIAIVTIIILISGIFVFTKSRPVENASISSAGVSSIHSNSKAVLTSNSQVAINSSQVGSKFSSVLIASKIEQPKLEIITLPKTEIVDGIEVTYLDSKNPPQYIKDYLACETKTFNNSHVGVFLIEDEKLGVEYKCPPKNFLEKCNYKIVYAPINDFGEAPKIKLLQYPNLVSGWNCGNPAYFTSYEASSNGGFSKNFCEVGNQNVDKAFIAADFDLDQTNHHCVVLTKPETSPLQKKTLTQDLINNFKKLETREIKAILII
jgi:hypothetical protein